MKDIIASLLSDYSYTIQRYYLFSMPILYSSCSFYRLNMIALVYSLVSDTFFHLTPTFTSKGLSPQPYYNFESVVLAANAPFLS